MGGVSAAPLVPPLGEATTGRGHDVLDLLVGRAGRAGRLTHTWDRPGRPGVRAAWPDWVDPLLRERLEQRGVAAPWVHQVAAAQAAWDGSSVVLATGTGSGKSLGYLLPVLTALTTTRPAGPAPTALYVAPTKALAADQAAAVESLALPGVRVACLDGDASYEARGWAREHATYLLTNPDMLHAALLPGHARWRRFLRGLAFVVVDEAHAYHGVFGAHVASVLRRLDRLATHHGASPTFLAASATMADPEATATRLLGRPVTAITTDASPRGPLVLALWEPPALHLAPPAPDDGEGEAAEAGRRSALAESADLLADLVAADRTALVFTRSRRGAEVVAAGARERLVGDPRAEGVAAYRGGFLPEERRALETGLRQGRLRGVATTSALELGVDVPGVDAVLLAGWPGSRTALWQRAGRAGRDHGGALVTFIAADDPLDHYLVHHPEAVLADLETTVVDPQTPRVLGPHLAAAAGELPLSEADLAAFGAGAPGLVDQMCAAGLLRRRPAGWYWAGQGRAGDLVDLRGGLGSPVRVVEEGTGRVVATVDLAAADVTVHPGAVYVHQGVAYLVVALDLAGGVALVHQEDPGYRTSARSVRQIQVDAEDRRAAAASVLLATGAVTVTTQVVGYARRRTADGRVLGHVGLDMAARATSTRGVWWATGDPWVGDGDLAGGLHGVEHAARALLPLVAGCDRGDVSGTFAVDHPATGAPTVFVYDTYPGGSGFADAGFDAAAVWLSATADAVRQCGCVAGCPTCVQSPTCGSGNDPLDKAASVALLTQVAAALSPG